MQNNAEAREVWADFSGRTGESEKRNNRPETEAWMPAVKSRRGKGSTMRAFPIPLCSEIYNYSASLLLIFIRTKLPNGNQCQRSSGTGFQTGAAGGEEVLPCEHSVSQYSFACWLYQRYSPTLRSE